MPEDAAVRCEGNLILACGPQEVLKAILMNVPSPKILKRLIAAEGYLELGMFEHALGELDAIEDRSDCAGPWLFLRGQSLQAMERYDEAIDSLNRAAQLFPFPHSKHIWQALSECCREGGNDELAEVAATTAVVVEHIETVLRELVERFPDGVVRLEIRL